MFSEIRRVPLLRLRIIVATSLMYELLFSRLHEGKFIKCFKSNNDTYHTGYKLSGIDKSEYDNNDDIYFANAVRCIDRFQSLSGDNNEAIDFSNCPFYLEGLKKLCAILHSLNGLFV